MQIEITGLPPQPSPDTAAAALEAVLAALREAGARPAAVPKLRVQLERDNANNITAITARSVP